MLPSGLVVRLERRDPPRDVSRHPGLFQDAVHRIESELTMKDERGERVHVGALELADFNALRAILARLGWIDEPDVTLACVNCDAELRVRPCATFELGPFVDRELDALARPAQGDLARLEPRTVAQARALHEALARGPISPTKKLVRAMGVAEFQGETDPLAIARRLRDCDDASFARVAEAFLDLAYPARLVAAHACPKCGARNDIDAPYEREFDRDARAREEAFASFDEFDAAARALASDLVPKDVRFVVEGGVPACDDGGVPLLGSYTPPFEGASDEPTRPGEVTVYYRTFRATHEDDGSFDWREELRETIEHELEHHLRHTGDDPMDDEERREIAREAMHIVGRRELRRREVRSLARDVTDFLRRTWPLWIGLLILAFGLTICGNSRV